jgi:Protein of unknown function (DUF3043)
VRFLGRSAKSTVGADSTTADGGSTGPADTIRVGGKGRPTPKRREAEAKRRGPAPPPPRTQREASKLARANRPDKTEQRRLSAERRERMAAGDERYLMARDRGPVKAYIRDVVDSRPHIVGLFMPLAVVVLFTVVLPVNPIQQYLSLFTLIALATMIVEGVTLGITITRKIRLKFPDERIGGFSVGWYAFSRASQIRRFRVPKPRVARGENPE